MAEKYSQAVQRSRMIAEHLKNKYNCRVFMGHSDIDIAIANLDYKR